MRFQIPQMFVSSPVPYIGVVYRKSLANCVESGRMKKSAGQRASAEARHTNEIAKNPMVSVASLKG
jgi:hypothetical protein